jgi:hypothetical protein
MYVHDIAIHRTADRGSNVRVILEGILVHVMTIGILLGVGILLRIAV